MLAAKVIMDAQLERERQREESERQWRERELQWRQEEAERNRRWRQEDIALLKASRRFDALSAILAAVIGATATGLLVWLFG